MTLEQRVEVLETEIKIMKFEMEKYKIVAPEFDNFTKRLCDIMILVREIESGLKQEGFLS